jgi:hypothetical protein
MAAHIAHIPNYLVARSPNGLRRLCLMNNAKKGHVFTYQIQYTNGRWYAWYIDTDKSFLEEIKKVEEAE